MDWSQVQTGFPVLVTELIDVPCEWADQSNRVYTESRAVLDVLHPESDGVDDVSWASVGDDEVEETITGLREFVISISIWTKGQVLQSSPRALLEDLRTKLRFSSSRDTLTGMGLVLVDIASLVDVDPVQESRRVGESVMDVRFSYVHELTDSPIPFIETARVYSDELRDSAGDPLPDAEQFDLTGPG